MTAAEWDAYGDACFSHDDAALTPELRAHMREQFQHDNEGNER